MRHAAAFLVSLLVFSALTPEVRTADEGEKEKPRDANEDVWATISPVIQKDLQGTELELFLKAVEKSGRCQTPDGRRDLALTRILVGQLRRHPDLSGAISKALADVTAHPSAPPHRSEQRAQWDANKWTDWQRNADQREEQIQQALGLLQGAAKKQGAENREHFAALLKLVDSALELLETAKGTCADDKEDETYCEELENRYTKMRYHFQKDQIIRPEP